MRLIVAMAMINGYHVEVITYPRLHELYLPNSQPRYHEVETCFGYDQWLSCFSTSVSLSLELLWLWSVAIVLKSRFRSYISSTYPILNLGIMNLRTAMAMINSYHVSVSRIHKYISCTYQILNPGDSIMRLRIAMAMINHDLCEIKYSHLNQLYLLRTFASLISSALR